MPLRVCILARENVLHWAPYYIEAFRECCDVITVGPALDRRRLDVLGMPAAASFLVPNDVVSEEDDAASLPELWPEGWRPDLVVAIQAAGTPYKNVAALGCPTAYLSVDTWHDHAEFAYVRGFDFVFPAQRSFVPQFRETGARHVHWLPLACSPRHHGPVAAEAEYDFVFVGATKYVVNEERIARLNRLAASFTVARQEGIGTEDMCACYALGRLGFNSSIAQDVNMRVFEVMAMGRPLFTNRDAEANGLFDLFEDGKHFIGYDDGDMLDRARHYLERPGECQAIAHAGRAEVLAKHTYRRRVDRILAEVRGAAPHPGQEPPPVLREGAALEAYIPCGAAHILDCKPGVDMDAFAPGEVDAVLVSRPTALGSNFEGALRCIHAVLCDGGALILRLDEEERRAAGISDSAETCDVWLYGFGFHLVLFHGPADGGGYYIVSARKYRRTVQEISEEIYTRFPGGQLSRRQPIEPV